MAYVKMGKIRGGLKGSIKYITNPQKTDNGLLCASNCAIIPGDADEVTHAMEMTLLKAENARTHGSRATVNAYHVIQSFKPGELTADEAHQIGLRFAQEITKDGYEFVLATHVDQGHIHNHIIHSAVNWNTLKRARLSKGHIQDLRDKSDELCREYGLSVIEPEHSGQSLGSLYARARYVSPVNYLMDQIDEAVLSSTTLDEMRDYLQRRGVTTETRGIHILFKAEGMKHAIRGKTLGAAYTVNGLMTRLGRDQVCEFTVAKNMLEELDAARVRVRLPKNVPYTYIIVPASRIVDYGDSARMFLPQGWDLTMLNRDGVNVGKIAVPDLYTCFSHPRISEVSGFGNIHGERGVSEAQRAYFARVDRKVDAIRADVDYLGVLDSYRSSANKALFTTNLGHRIETITSRINELLVSRQQASDMGHVTTAFDRQIASLTREQRAIFTFSRNHKVDLRTPQRSDSPTVEQNSIQRKVRR